MKIISNHSNRKLKMALIAAMVGSAGMASAGSNLTLDVTVGTDVTAGACAAVDTVTVDPGTDVNYCYTITNNGAETYETHSLDTNFFGLLLDNAPQTLAPAASFQFNDVQTTSSTTSLNADWTATGAITAYTQGAPVYDFVDISGTGTALGLSDDGESDLTIDFPFTLYNTTSADMTVGNNGAIRLGVLGAQIFAGNTSLTADAGNNLISPFWDDLDTETGDVYHETQGAAPNRVLIIQWEERPHFNGIGAVSLQLKLFETSNVIEFHYEDVQFEDPAFDFGASATVGIGGDAANVETSFNTASLTDASAISYTPDAPVSDSASGSALVVINAPDIDTPQASLDFSQNPDVIDATGNLEIDNLGTLVLNWNLEEQVGAGREFCPFTIYASS